MKQEDICALNLIRARFINRQMARRYDADETPEEEERPRWGGSGHGNTRIPFGLCEREGIQIEKGWTPADAWNALAGVGYSAGEVYKNLKETGKAVKSAKSKKELCAERQLRPDMFPAHMLSKAMKKGTEAYIGAINEMCEDPEVLDLLGCGLYGAQFANFKMMRTEGGCEVRVVSFQNGAYGEATMKVPFLSKAGTEDERTAMVGSFCHEFTHYLDDLGRDGQGAGHQRVLGCYTRNVGALNDAIAEEAENPISQDAKGRFASFKMKYDKRLARYKQDSNSAWKVAVDNVFDGERPSWIREDGTIAYFSAGYNSQQANAYQTEERKQRKAVLNVFKREARAIEPGSSCLQGLYDSISGGKARDTKVVTFGHGSSYFKQSGYLRASELLADYVALSVINPGLREIFDANYPKTSAALRETVVGLTKELKGE